MSYYYSYYIGYRHDEKIYPLGPYDAFGKLRAVVCRSRSFASDLHELFYHVKESEISDKLREEFEYTDWDNRKRVDVKWLPLSKLPSGSSIRKGYFLIEDVKCYEKAGDEGDDLFYDCLSPTVFAAKLQHEMAVGKPAPQIDEEGYEIESHSASDYMYYAYQNKDCKEYEAEQIRDVAYMLDEHNDVPEGATLVVLETEG